MAGRLLLFTGKGGVGKTTVAAATAVAAGRAGLRTLVVSTDPAHSLADAFGVPLGPTPTAVDATGLPGVFGEQADPRSHPDADWDRLQDRLLQVLGDLGVEPVAARELAELPGVDDVLTLLEVRRQALLAGPGHGSGGWDLVVVDCGPSAETMRLLAVAELWQRTLERLLPMPRRIARVTAAARRAGVHADGDRLAQTADRLAAQLQAIRDLLAAPTTSVRLVMTPETVVLAETRRTWSALRLHSFRVDGVVVNRVFEPDAADTWRARWGRAHAEVLAHARAAFEPTPVAVVPFSSSEPVGVEALAEVARQLYGDSWDDGRALPDPVRPLEPFAVHRTDSGFTLSVPVPLVERSELDLGRRGDDLVVGLGGRTRVITLPGALRRCRVDGARLHGGSLDVRFVPDPALWRTV